MLLGKVRKFMDCKTEALKKKAKYGVIFQSKKTDDEQLFALVPFRYAVRRNGVIIREQQQDWTAETERYIKEIVKTTVNAGFEGVGEICDPTPASEPKPTAMSEYNKDATDRMLDRLETSHPVLLKDSAK
jgi:hypothetical protein